MNLERAQRIIELTEENKFRSEIAEELGISKTTVWKYQKRLDLI